VSSASSAPLAGGTRYVARRIELVFGAAVHFAGAFHVIAAGASSSCAGAPSPP
jgi:hypothetical protein